MTPILRIAIAAFLVASCSTAANPTTTPLDHRHVFLVDLDAQRQLLVIDHSELITDALRIEVGDQEVNSDLGFLPGELPNEKFVTWVSRPCNTKQSLVVSRVGDRLSFDLYSGPVPAGVGCTDLGLSNAILVTFAGSPPTLTGRTHQGSPPQ